MKKVVKVFSLFIFFTSSLFALDLSVRLTPALLFPMQENIKTDLQGLIQSDITFFNTLNIGAEGLVTLVQPNDYKQSIKVIGGGLGTGVAFYPLPRLYLGLGGSAGIYSYSVDLKNEDTGETETKTPAGPYLRAYGEMGFRVNPTVSLNVSGGYNSFLVINDASFQSGPFAGLSVKVNFETGSNKSKGNTSAVLEQFDNIYPLFTPLYRKDSVGTIKITNNETTEIRNVHVSFRAGAYTSSTIECGNVPVIHKHKSVEVPFLADFSSEILNFSEDGQVNGEVIIEYELLGKKKQSIQNIIVNVNNKNAYLWGNDAALAAFISPDTPEVLELAKYISGIERNQLYTGMNRNIQFAAAMVEGLLASGITYSQDKITPYEKFHVAEGIDSVQYPLQTMNCLSGDYDDLGILLASCLESVGVSTGYLAVDNDFLVLVNLGTKPQLAANHFTNIDGLIYDDNKVYFPIAMSKFEKGFAYALSEGLEIVSRVKDSDKSYTSVDVENAWKIYPPVVYTRNSSFKKPKQVEVETVAKKAVQDYIDAELIPRIEIAKNSGDLNQLGLVYVRAGKYSDAKATFTKGANSGNLSSMNNLANLLFIEKDYKGAAAQYKKVLSISPNNRTALAGLEKANAKLTKD